MLRIFFRHIYSIEYQQKTFVYDIKILFGQKLENLLTLMLKSLSS
jgi:hypothetical protein